MIYLIVQLLLICLCISIVYFAFLGVSSLDFSFLPLIFEGLVVIIFTFLFSYFMILIVLAFINKIARVFLRDKEGELTGFETIFWTIKETAWDIARSLTKKIILQPLFPDILTRMFGFKRRKGVSIMADLWDLELIDVGEGTLIGTNAMITAHHIRGGKLYRKRIKIGKKCTLGILSIVLPGAEIGDNVMISAGSLVPANWKLDSNSIYSGVPVKKVKELAPIDE
ncbi:MAG: DapH/DapD/GlmU-related protein [Candidatus Thorarchaeota archaeon]